MLDELQGICLWITGLPASGKTTTSRAVAAQFARAGLVPSILDGDEVRSHLSRKLGFSRDDRMENVRRIAGRAFEVVRAGRIAIVSCISPYEAGRAEARSLISQRGLFVEIFTDAPLAVCEARDPKGLYCRARLGEIEHFTGISDPYEIPQSPDIRLDTVHCTPSKNAIQICQFLSQQKRIKLPGDLLFLCPQCREPLHVCPRCSCGFVLQEFNGVINLMTREQSAEVQPFLEAYEKVRSDERWGGDDLDLPFHPLRHRDIWNIRQRTFRAFEGILANVKRGVALDIGAGNCWMTRYLDRWGFDAIAVDINSSGVDGLRAGQKFIDEGARFLRVRAGMEQLPFAPERIRLLATNASFHYASDLRAALSEFERVLAPGGMIVILDTPFYKNASDGERMVAERAADFQQKYGIPDALARRARYLTFRDLEEITRSTNLEWRLHPVWPGLRRKYEEIRGALIGRRVAQFPVVVIEKHEA